MFHRVLPQKFINQPNCYSKFGTLISQEYFEKVVSLLKNNGFIFKTLSQLSQSNGNTRSVALTFDDGYEDNYHYAFPILEKYGVTATFFPIVEPCRNKSVLPLDIYYQLVDEMQLDEEERNEYIKGGRKKKFYWTEPNAQYEILKTSFSSLPKKMKVSYMKPDQLKHLSDKDFEIGSHGMTHALLIADYMTEQKVISELQLSKDWLEAVTGKSVHAFCFPAGRYNARIIELAKIVGYTSTCLVFRDQTIKEALPSFERFFVTPNSLNQLKLALEIE